MEDTTVNDAHTRAYAALSKETKSSCGSKGTDGMAGKEALNDVGFR
jgi:hypothetical protein